MMAAVGTAWAQTYINLSTLTGDITVGDGCTLSGTLDYTYKISIEDGATVTLYNANINPTNWWIGDHAGITCLGNATLSIVGTNTVRGYQQSYPGIYVPVGHTLTIQGGIGSLTAGTMGYGAGIGGGREISCGNIVIEGGNITAIGGYYAAGIGAGQNASCGTISITGGTVFAIGGGGPSSTGYAAGIGSGYDHSSCGAITISGGTVNATGSQHGSGIGSGKYGSSCGAITISGGAITATGGDGAAGIGSGYDYSSCGAITISGGFVTVQGGDSGSGIGSGDESSSCVSVDITGGIVNATGGSDAAGIGSGEWSSCGPVTITDGVTLVTAIKKSNIHSIGKGDEGTCGTVTIGGVVYWDGSNYQNGGGDPQTGIRKSPYYYPTPGHTLGAIPSDWTVTANGQTVTVTPYYENAPLGYASIPTDAQVVLTPPDPDRVISVTLIDPLTIPLTFEAKVAGAQVSFHIANGVTGPVQYSTDNSTWKTYKSDSTITLTNEGDKVSFRGTNATYAIESTTSKFSCSAGCYLYGNVMSLINKDNFATTTTLDVQASRSFYNLFLNNTNIYSHDTKPLLLPATILNYSCYGMMFSGCTNLTKAPELPATTLQNHCYEMMFSGCTNLTKAPELPATTLQTACYYGMFINCTSLTTPPELPATTLATSCYDYMFHGDTSLTTAPELPATTLAASCYKDMFYDCKNLTSAPVLPATTLTNICYSRMFYGCTKLNNVTCLATDISADNCTSNWLHNVAPMGTFTKAAAADWSVKTGNDGIPTGWTVENQ